MFVVSLRGPKSVEGEPGEVPLAIERLQVRLFFLAQDESLDHQSRLFTFDGGAMLYTLAVILLIAWVLGIVGTYTIGAFVHALLVIALVLFVVGLLSGRRTIV